MVQRLFSLHLWHRQRSCQRDLQRLGAEAVGLPASTAVPSTGATVTARAALASAASLSTSVTEYQRRLWQLCQLLHRRVLKG